MQRAFDFDLNEVPPPEDLDAATAREPSPPPPPPPPAPEVDGKRDGNDGQAEAAPPPISTSEMLDLDVSDDEEEEGEEGEIDLRSPAAVRGSPAPGQSQENTARSSSPEVAAVAAPVVEAGVVTATAPRPLSCADVHGNGSWGGWPDSETDLMLPPPPPLPLPPPPPPPSTFPARSSSGPSPSRAHANGRTSDTSSSMYDRRLFPVRDDDDYYAELFVDRPPAAYPRPRRDEGSRRGHGGPVARAHEAPPLRYTPYGEHGQSGYRGNARPQGDYRVHRGDRGYETSNFRSRHHSSSSSNQFAGRRDREEEFAGRQIPAQEVHNGGYRHHYNDINRDPPRGRGHFPAAQPRHPYARDAGEVDGANAGNHQARRQHRPPSFDHGNHQARRQHRPRNIDDGNHQDTREHRPPSHGDGNHQARLEHRPPSHGDGNHQARREHRPPRLDDGNHQARRQHLPRNIDDGNHRHNDTQNANRTEAGPVRRRQYYGDLYGSQSPLANP